MFVYEVNLAVKNTVFAEWFNILQDHNIEAIFETELFKAQIWQEDKKDKDFKYIKIHYTAKSLDELENLLNDGNFFPQQKLFEKSKIEQKILTQLHEIQGPEEEEFYEY